LGKIFGLLIIALMQDFFAEMWENNKKDTKLRHAELRLLLKETGFVPGTETYGRH
jgi:hypothetical protein